MCELQENTDINVHIRLVNTCEAGRHALCCILVLSQRSTARDKPASSRDVDFPLRGITSSIIVASRRVLTQVRRIGQRDACLLPDLELPVLRDLPLALVLLDRQRFLAVRRRAQGVSRMWVEVECRGVRDDL